jgi:hypothetical protein
MRNPESTGETGTFTLGVGDSNTHLVIVRSFPNLGAPLSVTIAQKGIQFTTENQINVMKGT